MTRGLLQLSGIVVDLVYRVDHLPAAGEEVEAPEVLVSAGGGFNAMIAAKNFGIPVAYGGTTGTGIFGNIARSMLHQADIPCIIRRHPALDQGTCVVIVDRTGERTFISRHGAERQLQSTDYEAVVPTLYDWILLTGYSLYKPESASVLASWLQQVPPNPQFLFDPGPTVSDIPEDKMKIALSRADWVSANRAEAAALTGLDDPPSAASALAKGRTGAIVRAGAEGCWIATRQSEPAVSFLPAFTVDAVDTNGAGDAHDGAFMAATLLGYTAQQAALLANASAALSTTRHGPARGASLAETLSFIASRGVSVPEAPARSTSSRRRK